MNLVTQFLSPLKLRSSGPRPTAAELVHVAAVLLSGETSRDGLVAIGEVRAALAIDTAAELWAAAYAAAASEDGRVPLAAPAATTDEEPAPCP